MSAASSPACGDVPAPIPRRWRRWFGRGCRVSRRLAGTGVFGCVALIWVLGLAGCGAGRESVVVYAAQDRTVAEPIFQAFARTTGIEVRAVYDNEATKTTGLANRVAAERGNPRADVWWSNEEMRTRQLVRMGVLESDWQRFGSRQRVWVVNSASTERLPVAPSLGALTNEALRGRVVMAYPLFGTTVAHLLVLRERWGDEAWRGWCRALQANRPLWVDGNSVVVKVVAQGQGLLGLTDTDDVRAARREGKAVEAVSLSAAEGCGIPNTVAVVQGAPHAGAARRLVAYLQSPEAVAELVKAGAIDPPVPVGAAEVAALPEPGWARVLEALDTGVRWLEETLRR